MVHCGSVPLVFSINLSLIANGEDRDNPSTVDLGGTTQDVQKTLLRGGVLNGSLSSGNQVVVDKFNSNIIADLDGQSGTSVKVGFYETSNPDVVTVSGITLFRKSCNRSSNG